MENEEGVKETKKKRRDVRKEMKRKEKEEVLMKVSTSRKLYLPSYLMILFLAALLVFLYFQGYEINGIVLGAFVIFTILVLNITETHRMTSSYIVTPDDVLCVYGIVSKRYMRLDYYAISDMEVNQNFWQRLLGYGDIEVKLFSKDNKVSMKNINKPTLFVKEVERVMGEKRK